MKFTNKWKIIIFEFPLTTETLHWLFWSWTMQSNWIWKESRNMWSLHSLSQYILLPLLFLPLRFLLWRSLLRFFWGKNSETTFPHRLNYGGNYKIFILPIVQKTARKKKNIHNSQKLIKIKSLKTPYLEADVCNWFSEHAFRL